MSVAVPLRIVAGILLLAHGSVHLLYLTPDAHDPKYPFTLRSSWLVPHSAKTSVATVLIAATVVAFALLALAIWGVPGLSTLWAPLALVAATTSLALLVAFWDTRLLFGVAIDVVLAALVLVHPGWTERISG